MNIATGKLLPADGSAYEDENTFNDAFTITTPTSKPQASFDDLEKAKKLYDDGTLSEEEFNKIKRNVLEKMQ